MNWNSHQFIWLDWIIIAVGIIAVGWAVYRSVKKHKSQQEGADSEDYLFGKGEPWYIIGAAILLPISVPSTWLVWPVPAPRLAWAWLTGKCRDG